MFCKKCGSELKPVIEMLNTDDPYYAGGARCRCCNYLYFPDYEGTWYEEVWLLDYVRRKQQLLATPLDQLHGRRRCIYLALHFTDCLVTMLPWYFESPEFDESDTLSEFFCDLDATEAVQVLDKVLAIADDPRKFLKEYGNHHFEVEDTWEEVGEELCDSLPDDLKVKVYQCLCEVDSAEAS